MNGLIILFLILPFIIALLVNDEMGQFILKCSYFIFVVTGFICLIVQDVTKLPTMQVFTSFFYWLYFLIVYVVVFSLLKSKNRERWFTFILNMVKYK